MRPSPVLLRLVELKDSLDSLKKTNRSVTRLQT